MEKDGSFIEENRMKKVWKRGLCFGLSLLMLLGSPAHVSFLGAGFGGVSYGAERPATVTATTLNVRSAPGTANAVAGKLTYGASVTVLGEAKAADGTLWYQIRFTGDGGVSSVGYVMGSYLKFPSSYSSDVDFEEYLNRQGFPESYRPGLRELHARYPQWVFTAFDTGLDWNEVIQNESLVGRNLVSSSSISSWKSTAPGAYDWGTSTWPGFDGSSWVAASEEIIRYYMDPRNFLNETYIFQFLLQDYDPSVHTREGLASMVKGTFLEGNGTVGGAYQGLTPGTSGGNTSAGTEMPGQNGQGTGTTGQGTGTTNNTGQGTGNSAGAGPGESSGGNSSVQTGYGPGFTQGAASGTQNNSGATNHGGTQGSDAFTDVWKGVSPGANISRGEEVPSYSRHQTEMVGETVALVGPGEDTETKGNDAQGANVVSGPGTNTVLETGSVSEGNGVSGVNQAPGTDQGNGVAVPGGTSGTVQTPVSAENAGRTVFSGTEAPYVDILIDAGIQSGVSPYVLTAMILQEQGREGKSDSISGKSGFYNFYNFEAYASNGMTPVQRGLWYASQSGSYLRPWNSADKSIIGGAIQYGQNYMKAGQNTFYLKKFNVQGTNLYKHQYMTNVEGAAAEGAKMGDAYSEAMRQTAMRFSIPVYRNMPESASVKPGGNGSPNNKLQSLTVNGYAMTPAFTPDTLVYDVAVGSGDASIMLSAAAADSTAVVTGTGTVALNAGVTEVKVRVTAQNGTAREYVLRVSRSGISQGQTSGSTSGAGTSGSGTTQPGMNTGTGSTWTPGNTAPAGNTHTGPGGSNVTIVP